MTATVRIHNVQPGNAPVRVLREPSGAETVLAPGEATVVTLAAHETFQIEPVDPQPSEAPAAEDDGEDAPTEEPVEG